MKMRTLLLATSFAFLICPAYAKEVDWKYYGSTESAENGTTLEFYLASDIARGPGRHLKVWTKSLRHEEVDVFIGKVKEGDPFIAKVAAKIAQYYVPPYARLVDLTTDEMIDTASYEAVANDGSVSPFGKLLYEINCTDKKLRVLDVWVFHEGKVISDSKPRDWAHIPPESNGNNLATLVCPL